MSVTDPAPALAPHRLLYPIAETEVLLGLSRASIYRLLQAGKLDAVKIGAATRIPAVSIERFIADCHRRAARHDYGRA